MSSFSTLQLIALILLSVHTRRTTTSNITDQPTMEPTNKSTNQPTVEPTNQPTVEPTNQPTVEPTNQEIERQLTYDTIQIMYNTNNEFPPVLPVLLKSSNKIIIFNFTKKYMNYNLPVYAHTKDKKNMVVLDTPPITNAAFYEDEKFNASVTLSCEENDPLISHGRFCMEQMMSGIFNLNGERYLIEPKKKIQKRFVVNLKEFSKSNFIRRHQVFKLRGKGYSCQNKNHSDYFHGINETKIKPHGKFKRTKLIYTIEILAMISHSTPLTQSEINLRKIYYTHVFWQLNKIFNNIVVNDMVFGVNLIGFILQEVKPSGPIFTRTVNNEKFLDLTKTRLDLMDVKIKNRCDHLTYFSPYKIASDRRVVGMTDPSGICLKNSVSIVMAMGNFEEVAVLAHQLGHSLGSMHDDLRLNTCRKKDGYIMSSSNELVTIDRTFVVNGFKFSECSIKAMVSHIKKLNPNCLLNMIRPPILPEIPAGQLYPVRQQCRVMSDRLGLCPIASQNSSSFCLSLWCAISNVSCQSFVPAYKTTCGNKKWCIFGNCVYDKKAPLADESCLYGDEESIGLPVRLKNGTTHIPKNCAELFHLAPNFCRIPELKKKCCATCFEKAHPGNKLTTAYPMGMPRSTTISADAFSGATKLNSRFFPLSLGFFYFFQLGKYFLS